jgi:hypothetical protein
VSERWRTRLPDDPEEEKEWKEKWISRKGTTELPISEVIQRFGTFLSNELGTKKLRPRSKKWFRTVRKAKRTCWETFLQEGTEEDICKEMGFPYLL